MFIPLQNIYDAARLAVSDQDRAELARWQMN
jgi:hypothetical protein